MADTFDLQGLLAQFQPTQADQDAARKQAIIAASLGLLGTQRGHEGQALGQAGLLGMQTYTNALNSQQKAAMEKMQAASMAMQLQTNAQAYKDMLQGRDITRQAFNAQAPAVGAPSDAPQQPAGPSPAPPATPPQKTVSLQGNFSPSDMTAINQDIARSGYGQMGYQLPGQPPAQPPQMQPPAQPPMPSAAAPMPPSPKQQAYQQLMRVAQIAAQQGRGDLAMQYQEQALKFAPKIFKTEEGTDPQGNRVQVNYYDDGTHQILSDVGPAKKEAKMVDTGSVIGAVDPFTGQPIAGGGLYNKTVTPGEQLSSQTALRGQNMSASTAANSLAESVRYHNLEMGGLGPDGQPANVEGVAQAIANYKQPPLSSFAMSKPIGSAIMSKVMEINPSYDAQQYATRLKAGQAFSAGKEAQTTRSIGVALQHLDVLDKTVDALNNGNLPVLNQLSNIYKTQTGQPGPTNFASTKQIVANEIVKAIIGSGGGVEDRRRASEAVSSANSPQQLKGVIGQYKQLMAGQLGGLRQQYEASGNTDFDKYLSPEAQALTAVGGGSDIRSKADAILRGGK